MNPQAKEKIINAVPLTNRCNTCPYWKHEAAMQQRVKAALAGQPDVVSEAGLCYFNPPTQIMIPVPNPLDSRQVTMQSQRVFPFMLETEFCSHHPGRVLDRERSLEFAREKARRDLIAYDPDKFPDAGFNHPPSFAAAKQMAVVADGRTGDTVTCPGCGGKGWLQNDPITGPVSCKMCKGSGMVSRAEVPAERDALARDVKRAVNDAASIGRNIAARDQGDKS